MAYVFIILTVLFWGTGAFLGKTVLKEASSIYVYILEALGTVTVAFLVSLFFRKEFISALSDFNWLGYLFGVLWGIGTVTFIIALKYKPASSVVPITALYPLVTAVLAIVLLREAITIKIGFGIACAILAAMLLI
jgi:transporter family protein